MTASHSARTRPILNLLLLTVVAACNGVAKLTTPPPVTAAPSALALVLPAPARETPRVRVSGVESGDTVRLFTDSSCTTEVASGVASGTTIDLTTTSLAMGNYTFYSNSTNAKTGVSKCSSASVAYSVVIFAGISTIDQRTDSTLRINWLADSVAVSYRIYDMTSGSPVLVTTVAAPATSATLTGRTPSTLYTFRVRSVDSSTTEDTNTNNVSVTMNAAPDIPSGLTLNTPHPSRETPSIRVAGVKNGDTVRVFTDNGCTAQVASGVATGSTINLTTSVLPAGPYTFFANATNSVPNSSACSTASVAYTVDLFSGITSITNKSDTALTINWLDDAAAVTYEIYEIVMGSPVLRFSVADPAVSRTVTGLTPGQTYTYRVRAKDSLGNEDSNTNSITVTMNAAPTPPSGFSLVLPNASRSTPVVQVQGVKTGDLIRLYSGPGCTNLVASGTAAGDTINLTSSALALGSYSFYATASSALAVTSACSTATLPYDIINCPPEYVQVNANPTLGVGGFCVMKYEAKEDVGSVPVSQMTGSPWVSVTQTTAKTACTSLPGFGGGTFDLMSNAEWMTIAREIEGIGTNWTSGTVGTGKLFVGHSDFLPGTTLDVTDDTDPYDGTGNTAVLGQDQRRTYFLGFGDEIWDISGNVNEWVDWTLGGALDLGPLTCPDNWVEFPDVAAQCPALTAAEYLPGNPANVTAASYTSTFNLGRIFGTLVDGGGNPIGGGAAKRGGGFNSGGDAGLFTLSLQYESNEPDITLGFRCVYRP